MGLTFQQPRGGRVVLSAAAHDVMIEHRQRRWWSKEAGGVLLGRHLLESGDLAVDEVTVPQTTDICTRTSFFRSAAHQALALAKWHASGGTCGHLGLWHTHPEPVPTPSSIDLSDWRNALVADRFEGASLLFVIVGQRAVRCWQGWRDTNGEFLELTNQD